MAIIAVDFDGTILQKAPNSQMRVVVPYMVMAINRWRSDGHKIILWTSRQGIDLEHAVEECRQHGIPLDAVNDSLCNDRNSRKIKYDYLIDDKCPFPVFDQVGTLSKILEEAKQNGEKMDSQKRYGRRQEAWH